MEEIRPLFVNVNSLQHSIDVIQTQIKQLTEMIEESLNMLTELE